MLTNKRNLQRFIISVQNNCLLIGKRLKHQSFIFKMRRTK